MISCEDKKQLITYLNKLSFTEDKILDISITEDKIFLYNQNMIGYLKFIQEDDDLKRRFQDMARKIAGDDYDKYFDIDLFDSAIESMIENNSFIIDRNLEIEDEILYDYLQECIRY